MNAPGPLPHIDNTTFRADASHRLTGRKGYPIRLIVLHNTVTADAIHNAPSGPWLSTQSPGGESAHHLYGRDGTRYDIVARADTAYHAGVAAWNGYSGDVGGVSVVNLVSIGHELESTATASNPGNRYTPAQIATLAHCIATEMVSYGIPWGNLVTHEQIALPPGRKTDPNCFDQLILRQQIAAWLTFLRSLPPDELSRWCI